MTQCMMNLSSQNSNDEGWVSVVPDVPSSYWVHFDVDASGINLSALGAVEAIAKERPKISFSAATTPMSTLAKLAVIPGAAGGSFLVSGEMLDLFKSLSTDDFELLDTTIACKDDVMTEFKVVHPLKQVACTDFSRSKVDWLLENFLFADAEDWYFLPNALDGAAIAKEKHTGKTVVSDELKTAMTQIAPKEVLFVRPNDYPW